MRRALATLLFVLIGLPPVLPLLLSEPSPQLPACCRKEGKHHCSMAMASRAPVEGPALQSRCPLFPKAPSSTSLSSKSAVAADARVVGIVFSASALPRAAWLAPSRPSADTAHLRGPPLPFDLL